MTSTLTTGLALEVVALSVRGLKLAERRGQPSARGQRRRPSAEMIVHGDDDVAPVARRSGFRCGSCCRGRRSARVGREQATASPSNETPGRQRLQHGIMIAPCASRAGLRLCWSRWRGLAWSPAEVRDRPPPPPPAPEPGGSDRRRPKVQPAPPPAALPTGSSAGRSSAASIATPLARARVVLTSPALAEPRVTLSGADGTYQFQHLPAGSYSLSATRSGYAPQEYGQRRSRRRATVVPLGDGQRLTGIDFALAPAGVIAGRILDEDDKPFAGATVDALISRTDDGQADARVRRDGPDRRPRRVPAHGTGGRPVLRQRLRSGVCRRRRRNGAAALHAHVLSRRGGASSRPRASASPPASSRARIVFKLKIIRPSRVSGVIGAEGRRQLLSGAVIMAPIRGEWLNAVADAGRRDPARRDRSRSGTSRPGRTRSGPAARWNRSGKALFATYKVLVDGHDISDVELTLQPGASIAGHLEVRRRPAGQAATSPSCACARHLPTAAASATR